MALEDLARAARRNPGVAALLGRPPQRHPAGGCLFQTVWNLSDGRPPGCGIRDHDVFYWGRRHVMEGAGRRE